jgi:nucleoside-diphosphate-sugar epimerase
MNELSTQISGRSVLITGGLGMIGSTLAHKLVAYGAKVTVLDACIEPFGANMFNIADIKDRIQVNICDIRDKESIKFLVRDQDIIFNLAAQICHNDSIENPHLDADINYIGHLNVLDCIRRYNKGAVVVHSGSRLQFGEIKYNPVDEAHPLNPRTPYALNKTAAENTYQFYNKIHGINTIAFRIANPYGPRSQMKHHKYSMINWFIRLAMEGKPIRIFGDGSQVRDYIYVDDLADCFIAAAINPDCYGEVFNVGSGEGTRFREMVQIILEVVGNGTYEYVPWPEDYINVETGDYITDIGKISDTTGWTPSTCLKDGILKTYEYYKKNWSFYF